MTAQAIAKIGINPFIAVFIFLALLLLKRRCHKGHVFLFALFLYAVSVPASAKIIGRAWSVDDTLETGSTYDYAVVLSGMVDWDWYGRSERKPALRCFYRFGNNADRLLAGLDFLQAGSVRQLLIGALVFKQVNEAEIIAAFLEQQGINPGQYLVYGPVNNTLDEAEGVKKITERHAGTSLLLITSADHMRRAAALFAKQGLFPDLYSVSRGSDNLESADFMPSASGVATNQKKLYELVGYAGYFLLGKI